MAAGWTGTVSDSDPDSDPDSDTARPTSSHETADWFDQSPHRLRFGWGPNGLRRLAPLVDAVVIVDVLSFSTSVDIALGRGAAVLPYRWHDGTEHDYAAANDAEVAAKQARPDRLSLRPSSLQNAEPGMRLVLPSPNGSALAFAASDAGASTVLVGCLRNRTAVANAVSSRIADRGGGGGSTAVLAAGERWRGTTGPLRPAIEDLIGAGAILDALAADLGDDANDWASPEAMVAIAAFRDARPRLVERIRSCGSGRELIEKGFPLDVDLAADLDSSPVAPLLDGPALRDAAAVADGG